MKEDKPWSYLSYVTLRDIISASKDSLIAWLSFTAIILLIGWAYNIGADSIGIDSSEEFIEYLPKWAWLSLIYAAAIWFLRGKELKFVMPNLGFKTWLFISLVMTVIFYMLERVEWWIVAPIIVGLIIIISLFDDLALIGKENYDAINAKEEKDF